MVCWLLCLLIAILHGFCLKWLPHSWTTSNTTATTISYTYTAQHLNAALRGAILGSCRNIWDQSHLFDLELHTAPFRRPPHWCVALWFGRVLLGTLSSRSRESCIE